NLLSDASGRQDRKDPEQGRSGARWFRERLCTDFRHKAPPAGHRNGIRTRSTSSDLPGGSLRSVPERLGRRFPPGDVSVRPAERQKEARYPQVRKEYTLPAADVPG